MSDALTDIRNIGPAVAENLKRAGISTASELHALGPDAAYERLLLAGDRPHFIPYYALVMGLQGRPWNDCKGKEKDDLRVRFDAIVAKIKTNTQAAPSGIESILNEIGTGTKRT